MIAVPSKSSAESTQEAMRESEDEYPAAIPLSMRRIIFCDDVDIDRPFCVPAADSTFLLFLVGEEWLNAALGVLQCPAALSHAIPVVVSRIKAFKNVVR
jgi:hypothetical protein